MSHIANISLVVKDLDVLKKTCKEMGFEFMEGQTKYKWFGQFVGDSPMPEGLTIEQLGKCSHAIRVPGATYEIGVIRDQKNPRHYHLHCDEWVSGGLVPKIGIGGGLLKQQYAKQNVLKATQLKRLSAKESKTEDGHIKLRILIP